MTLVPQEPQDTQDTQDTQERLASRESRVSRAIRGLRVSRGSRETMEIQETRAQPGLPVPGDSKVLVGKTEKKDQKETGERQVPMAVWDHEVSMEPVWCNRLPLQRCKR